jgi:hypothetical protein
VRGGHFAAGRTTKSILEKYDADSGDFVEEVLETSPYTYVLFDCQIGYLAIAKKTRLAPTVSGIARRICTLFQSTPVVEQGGIEVSFDAISDPNDFIQSVQSAYSVRSFEFTFSRSNPFDADEFFQKRLEGLLEAADGQKGKTLISGPNLAPDTLVALTQSVAATGNDAKAVLQTHRGSKFSHKRLRSNPAHFTVPGEDPDLETALIQSRNVYSDVRGEENVLEDD